METEVLDAKSTLYCSFCGKSQHEVKKLIAGPTVFICDECIELCDYILIEETYHDRIVFRLNIPPNYEFDDAIYNVIATHISEEYPDIDFTYESRSFDYLNKDENSRSNVVFSFNRKFDYIKNEAERNEKYEMLKDDLKNAIIKINVLTKKYLHESELRRNLEMQLLNLKAEFLDYIRKNVANTEKHSDIRAIMFLDITGFSKFEFNYKKQVVDMLRGMIPPLVSNRGAQDINMWGDAVVANFVDPNLAVSCAVKFLRHLSVERLEARVGMAWGEIRISHNVATGRPDVDGAAVDLAARLEQMAPVGGILLSKEFGALDIDPSIGEIVHLRTPVKKAFGEYETGEEIEVCRLAIKMN